jgi:hypothetical protein
MANKISKLIKVGENITINRYDNGWMIEIYGRDKNEDHKSCKIICSTETELLDIIKEWNAKELDN